MVYGCYETRKVHKVELRNRDVFHINMICMLGNESTKRLNITIENKAKFTSVAGWPFISCITSICQWVTPWKGLLLDTLTATCSGIFKIECS